MSSVVSITDQEGGSDPFAGDRIEIPEDTMRKVSFLTVWLGRVKTRLDRVATRLTYGDIE